MSEDIAGRIAASDDPLETLVRYYVSDYHRDNPGQGCGWYLKGAFGYFVVGSSNLAGPVDGPLLPVLAAVAETGSSATAANVAPNPATAWRLVIFSFSSMVIVLA